MSTERAQPETPAPEELARANVYGLLARLFYAAPDQQLLGEMVRAPEAQGAAEGHAAAVGDYASAWRAVVDACATAYPVMLENEHTELFAAPGKALVTPYLLHYVMRYENETPLVTLREQLSRWGLARNAGTPEPEDHVSAMCEVMRMIIAAQQRSLEEQNEFFGRFLYPGASLFCDAVTASPQSNFYRHVARLAKAFFDLEHEAFLHI